MDKTFTVEFTHDELAALFANALTFVNRLQPEHYYDEGVVALRSAATKITDILLEHVEAQIAALENEDV